MINNISFNFKLFDDSNKAVADLAVNIQYFNLLENQWISVYNDVIKQGQLTIVEKATSRAKALKVFLDKIKAYEIPELRIVPEQPIYKLAKQEVLSIAYEFEYLKEESRLNFDFGTAWLLDKKVLKANDRFKTFFWISAPYSFVNQKENIEKILSLEKKLLTAKTSQSNLDQTNKQLNVAVKEISQQHESINAKSLTDLSLVKESESRIVALVKDLSASKESLQTLQKSYALINQEYENLKNTTIAQNAEWNQKLNELAKSETTSSKLITDLQSKLKEASESKIALEYDFKSTTEEMTRELIKYQNELEIFKERIKNIEIVNQEKTKLYAELKISNEILNQEKETLSSQNALLNNEVLSLNQQLEELSQEVAVEDRPVAVKNIYKNILQEIDLGSELAKSNNYSLANLSINLKGVISQDANQNIGIQLFSKETASNINGNTISDISFSVIPSTSQTIVPGITPDVTGLTETAVTRILDSIGLKLNPVYQKSDKPNGASIKQTPKSGIAINPNEFVTVIFSKNE